MINSAVMEQMPKSTGEKVIEQMMEQLDPTSDRYQVLATAKRFKSSWVELGEKLQVVRKNGKFQEWGYDSFEEYCSREIRIKKPTAQKLTQAYRFLEKEEPGLLARQRELKPLPDYRSVDLLRRAREEENFSDEDFGELRRAVLEEDRSHPTILKKFRETVRSGEDEAAASRLQLKSALTAARRLSGALSELDDCPAELRESVEEVILFLEERSEEAEAKDRNSENPILPSH